MGMTVWAVLLAASYDVEGLESRSVERHEKPVYLVRDGIDAVCERRGLSEVGCTSQTRRSMDVSEAMGVDVIFVTIVFAWEEVFRHVVKCRLCEYDLLTLTFDDAR